MGKKKTRKKTAAPGRSRYSEKVRDAGDRADRQRRKTLHDSAARNLGAPVDDRGGRQ